MPRSTSAGDFGLDESGFDWALSETEINYLFWTPRMVRYNAAHPGAEEDIFPHVDPGRRAVVAYTATRWRKLLKRPRGWDGRVPTTGDCYRFCLTEPKVSVVLTGPKNRRMLEANLEAVRRGPLSTDELAWMRDFGRVVHG